MVSKYDNKLFRISTSTSRPLTPNSHTSESTTLTLHATTPPPRHPHPHRRSPPKLGVAVDLSDESAYAVRWAVDHYIRPGDAVILLHVSPTSNLEHDFDAFTAAKAGDIAKPLKEAQIPYKIHIVKDHDMKERLCLEVERLGLSAVIMGSRGFGAVKRGSDGRLGSVSDYCVHHCVCPVVVVRYPEDKDDDNGGGAPDAAAAVVAIKRMRRKRP
ncbi:hypothetical protein M0R45_015037 [Rubus argutus]|uniref:UspA domain-containing protein n=1 Tax=Rubus argutus TaxID=59490 RepID=A0AAW1XP03_RUBAR